MGADDLAGTMTGPVLGPDGEGYGEAVGEVHNARFVDRPEVAAVCEGSDDVAAAVRHAREDGLALTVRGGGHSYAGNSAADGGLLVDLSRMDDIAVDPDARTVTVGPGAQWAQIDAATQAHGLATTGATTSPVGVAGYTLGGGTGNLSRALGLACDNLLSAEVVTADGERHRASEDENAELFWALRGAGHNFGVVTSFELALHEVGPEVLSGQIIYPFDDAADLLRTYRDVMTDAPDELQVYAFMFKIPPVEPFPEVWHGEPALDLVVFHADPEALDAVQPLRDLGDTILDAVAPTRYTVAQQTFDANLPAGQRYYSRAHDLAEIGDDAIATVVEHVPSMEGAFTASYFEPLGGAIGRVDPDETAIGRRREARCSFHTLGGWADGDGEGVKRWVRGLHDALAPHATGSVYVNLLGEDEEERLRDAYSDYDRLAELKARWDPDNVFAANHNIEPAG
jgi:FAD/FMN-containing dehydrogenase